MARVADVRPGECQRRNSSRVVWSAVAAYTLSFGVLLGEVLRHSVAGTLFATANVIAIGSFIAMTRRKATRAG